MSYLDTQIATIKRWTAVLVQEMRVLSNYWGERWVGGGFSLIADEIAEASMQAVLARFPGNSQQAPDSLVQSALDRDLVRFRGETDVNWKARVKAAWDDYAQGGSPQQLIRVVNQWGNAGWPITWVNLTLSNLDETSFITASDQFVFQLTIPYGGIVPAWVPVTYGSGHLYGELGLYYGIGPSTDIPMLLYIVKKWKPSRSMGLIKIFWGTSPTNYATFTV